MKYLTHLTVASEDDKFEDLRRLMGEGIHGKAAYGIYWTVAELIGAQIRPESVSTSLTKTEKKWAEKLDIRVPFFQKWKEAVRLAKLARVETNGKLVTIDMPNILKYCDEYSRKVGIKSGRAPDKLRTASGTPALPALPEVQDLKPGPVDNSDNSRGAPTAGVLEAPPSERQKKKSDVLCKTEGCSKRWVINRLCRECHEGKENTGTIPGIGNIGAIK